MPTFVPPVHEGNARTLPGHPANRLYRFFGAWAQGATVWKDSQGVWHESTTPYLGGAIHAVHDGPTSTYTGPDEGLATAQVVYLGGHVHTITEDEATELTAAGYGAFIEP